MILKDRILAHKSWEAPFARDLLRGVPAIVVNNVTDYYFPAERPDRAGRMIDPLRKVPNAAPPLDAFWMETRAPTRGKWCTKDPYIGGEAWGALIRSLDLKPSIDKATALRRWFYENDMEPAHTIPDEQLERITRARWISIWDAVLVIDGRISTPFRYLLPIADNGKIDVEALEMWSYNWDSARSVEVEGMGEVSVVPGAAGLTLLSGWIVCLLMGISFMHCKNVHRSEVRPPEKLSKATEKRHGVPLCRYHVLQIEPVAASQENRASGKPSSPRSLHICRGHFATYTAERRLFGRIEGTFWIPQHIRGDKRHGIVLKDYDVHPRPSA